MITQSKDFAFLFGLEKKADALRKHRSNGNTPRQRCATCEKRPLRNPNCRVSFPRNMSAIILHVFAPTSISLVAVQELRVITAAIANDEPGLKPVQKIVPGQNQTQ